MESAIKSKKALIQPIVTIPCIQCTFMAEEQAVERTTSLLQSFTVSVPVQYCDERKFFLRIRQDLKVN